MTDNERPLYRYPVHAADTHGTLHYIWTLPDVNVDAYLGFQNAVNNRPVVVFVRSNESGDWKWSSLTSLIDVRNWFGTGSDMTRAMTYHKAKDMIAAMNKYSKVEEACLEYFGERCPDYEPGCPTCEGWRQFDRLCDAHNKRRGT